MKMKIFLCYFLLKLFVAVESRRIPRGFYDFYLINVTKVVSGDSLIIHRVNETGKSLNFRMIEIVSPRLNQSYGVAAKEYLEKILQKNKKHSIGVAVKNYKLKSGKIYGRLYVGRKDINRIMVLKGFARCYNIKKCSFGYRVAMRRAQFRRAGMWKDKKSNFPKNHHRSKYNNKTKTTSPFVGKSIPVTLSRVVDGDTVYVVPKDSKNSSIVKVRMTGIDSPEMKQAFGPEAKNHLETIFSNLPMGTFTLLIEGVDKYKRSLGVIFSGSFDVNKKMVDDGYAWCYRHTQCPKLYQDAMKKAQENRKGLFVQKDPIPPWEWRKQQKN